LRKGITIDGERFQPMEVKIDRHQGANAWLTVGLREGRNREIRRAMEHIGVTVNRLIRISYGPFRLNEMEPGEVEEIKPRVLREQLGLAEGEAPAKPALRRAPRKTAGQPGAEAPEAAAGAAKRPARPTAAPGRTAKPGAGLKTLSDSWQKATRRPAGSATGAAGPAEKPARGPRSGTGAASGKPPRSTRATDPRPDPRTDPRTGPKRPPRPRKD
jgi:23S rRNA pseudouridine2605 synthase